MNKGKIMVVSDGSHHETGYARQGKSLCSRLVNDGYEVYCYAPGGFSHGQYTYHHEQSKTQWEVLSARFGDTRAGDDGFPFWLDYYNPDLVITMLDPCVLEKYGYMNVPTFMWAPIDSWPVNGFEAGILKNANKVICPSKWGQQQLKDVGIESTYCPYGYEQSELYSDFAQGQIFRDALGINENTFLIGMVGVHYKYPDRKGYQFALEAIAIFVNNHPDEDIKCFINTNLRTGEEDYLNLEGVRSSFNLDNIVRFSRPTGPRYQTNEELRMMLNSFDVLLQSSMTEGFRPPRHGSSDLWSTSSSK